MMFYITLPCTELLCPGEEFETIITFLPYSTFDSFHHQMSPTLTAFKNIWPVITHFTQIFVTYTAQKKNLTID